MGHIMLWIEGLALPLMLLALWLAILTHPQRRVTVLAKVALRIAAVLFALIPLAVYGGFTAIIPHLYFAHLLRSDLFSSLVALTAAYALGAILIVFRGLRRRNGQPTEAAARWPRGKLAMASLAVAAATAITVAYLDEMAKQQAAALWKRSKLPRAGHCAGANS